MVEAFEFAGVSTDSLNIDSIPEQAGFEWSVDAAQIPRDAITILLRIVNNANVDFNIDAKIEYQSKSQPLYIFRAPRPTGTDQDIQPITPFQWDPRETKVPHKLSENNKFNKKLFRKAVRSAKRKFKREGYKLISETEWKQESGVVDGDKGILLVCIYIC